MSSTKRVEVGWEHGGEDFRVVCNVTAPTRATFDDPGAPGEVEIVEVREEAPGGAERPDLLEAARSDFARIEEKAAEEASDVDEPEYDTVEEARGER